MRSPAHDRPLLDGVRILDCTRNIAGPVATMLAAEFGAEVVKVEPPGGDEMRRWPPFRDEQSAYFVSCNRGKRSIALDLKAEGDRRIFDALLARADVFVENYRPGTLERLGISWDEVHAEHPELNWVSVTGYGPTGPRAAQPAYDSMMQAYVGLMGITGEADGAPVRAGGSPIDIATSYLGWGAIMACVANLRGGGEGLRFDLSLMESAIGIAHAYFQGALFGSPLPGRLGSETMGIYPLGVFPSGDGKDLMLQVSNEHQWQRFCAGTDSESYRDDPRFATNPDRVQNRAELRPLLVEALAKRSADDWTELFSDLGVPASTVKTFAEVAKDPQLRAREMVTDTRLPSGETVPTWGVPVKVHSDGVKVAGPLSVPGIDEHRAEIVAELGGLEKRGAPAE
ncbi:CaiB/BaiF CoA transferase family protein [Amycolatopsis nivea]|uniref:CaiB/BaiF CoA transferase family protein n=1 Tax=Amycolatopsis nivea TaxID=1644109 RepID=UPI00106FE407|nr:CoA transferase [Amycolatopsis nivea]